MNTPSEELLSTAKTLDMLKSEFDSPAVSEPLQKLQNASSTVGKSWSGSWLGYHSRVYYRNFQLPPTGARFSQEWGFIPHGDTSGDWVEYNFDDVRDEVFRIAGNPDVTSAKQLAERANEVIDDKRSEMASLLTSVLAERSDPFLENLKGSLDAVKSIHEGDFVTYAMPKGQLISRDTSAIGQGFRTPPHMSVMAEVVALQSPAEVCGKLSKIAKQAASHLTKRPTGSSTASVPLVQSPISSTGLTFPDKVTVSWLYHYVPVPIWVTLAGLITAAFIGGVTLGQTTFVRELLGKATPAVTVPEQPKLSSEELKARVDQLVQGHNESIKNLYTAIANEEKEAGQKYFSSEQQPHIDAAKRLKETLRQENERFEQQLKALKELEQ